MKPDIFTHPTETWTPEQCRKAARQRMRDGLGTVGGPKGLIAPSGSCRLQYGSTIRYNGGTVINGEWYAGEHKPLPVLPDGFEFRSVTSWGICIVETK